MPALKFLKILVAVLLLINIGTLTFFWVNRPLRDGSPRHGGGPGMFLVRALKLNESQQRQYGALRGHHHEAMVMMRMKAAGYRHEINTQLKATQPDKLMIKAYCDSIGYCQRDVERLTFYHFRDLRSICDPAQQQRFDEVIHDAIEMIVHEK